MCKFKKFGILLFLMVALLASSSCTFTEKTEPIEVDTLVVSSRNHTRMQPEIFYAFKVSAEKVEPILDMEFMIFNPFKYDVHEEGPKFQKKLKGFLDILNECVPEVVAIKKANPQTDKLLSDIHEYIRKNPKSNLAKLHSKIEEFMEEFEFLIIESSDTYGIHPMFYKPNITQVETSEGANEKDIIEALYGLFFIDAAFKQNKPIWGTCHGAQMGYVHAGGRLGRLFEYNEDSYDVHFRKRGQKNAEVETWRIGKTLNTQEEDEKYIEHGLAVYPVPKIFKGKEKHGKKMFMNKDFDHSFAMIEPVPDDIQVISYHPLSEYKEKSTSGKYEEFNKDFEKIFKNQIIVDAYKYKTMIGTQYHPQYTHDDLETPIVFEYLVEQLADRYKE